MAAIFFKVHTDELQHNATTSLYELVCSMYKVCFHPVLHSEYMFSHYGEILDPVDDIFLFIPFVPRVLRYHSVVADRDILEATARRTESPEPHHFQVHHT